MNELWIAQVRGVMRLELRRSLLSRRALPIYFVGAFPLFAVVVFVIGSSFLGVPDEFKGHAGSYLFFRGLFELILRFGVFYFGCVWIFMNLFRGEVLDRSLHYYFLSPIRREVLAAGKFVSAWITSILVFGGSTVLCFAVINVYLGAGLGSATLGLMARYFGVVALSCLGYGAVFLVVGLFMRSMIIPALLIFLWESINTFVPGILQKISVIFYVKGMLPLPPADGPVSIIAEPVSPWLAVPGLILFTALTLVAAGLRIRRMEIAYGSE